MNATLLVKLSKPFLYACKYKYKKKAGHKGPVFGSTTYT